MVYPDLPNKGQVHPQRPVSPGAVYTEEHPVGDAGPAGVFSCTVKANLNVQRAEGDVHEWNNIWIHPDEAADTFTNAAAAATLPRHKNQKTLNQSTKSI